MAQPYRVAIIGRTGRGNYGHNLHTAWATCPGVEVVALADDDAGGREKAGAATGARKLYADYREMIQREQPQIVVVGPRWVDCHLDMVLAAAAQRAHIFMEKPMGRSPEECDRMIDACDRAHVKIAVAHNMRVCPILDWAEREVKNGIIGQVQEIRTRGKEDKRSGGEDMMVLGTHGFDLMRRFLGDPVWAFGRIQVEGREAASSDVRREGPEGYGLMLGDTIEGMFSFAGGQSAYFASRRSPDVAGQRWGFDLYGTAGVIAIRCGHVPKMWISRTPSWTNAQWTEWKPPAGAGPKDERDAYHLMAADLFRAIETDGEPEAGGRAGRWALEMAMALYASHRTGARVALPLKLRRHPLA